jgi:hypothetical protein
MHEARRCGRSNNQRLARALLAKSGGADGDRHVRPAREHGLVSIASRRRLTDFRAPGTDRPQAKRPLVALLKQARAFGVGVVVATQNPMDLDYRALSNAGLWCVGRLQTDADRERIVEGLSGAGLSGAQSAAELTNSIKRLAPRWFVMRDAHSGDGAVLLQPRWAMSFLRGPMTRTEIQLARSMGSVVRRDASPPDGIRVIA